MTSKNQTTFALALMAILLVVGVICYVGFAQEPPEQPIRMMFKTTAGSVLFDHKTHTDDAGYGLPCDDCHHEQQEDTMSCSGEDCHGPDSDPTLSDAMHMRCKGCHEENGAGPVDCAQCHVMK